MSIKQKILNLESYFPKVKYLSSQCSKDDTANLKLCIANLEEIISFLHYNISEIEQMPNNKNNLNTKLLSEHKKDLRKYIRLRNEKINRFRFIEKYNQVKNIYKKSQSNFSEHPNVKGKNNYIKHQLNIALQILQTEPNIPNNARLQKYFNDLMFKIHMRELNNLPPIPKDIPIIEDSIETNDSESFHKYGIRMLKLIKNINPSATYMFVEYLDYVDRNSKPWALKELRLKIRLHNLRAHHEISQEDIKKITTIFPKIHSNLSIKNFKLFTKKKISKRFKEDGSLKFRGGSIKNKKYLSKNRNKKVSSKNKKSLKKNKAIFN